MKKKKPVTREINTTPIISSWGEKFYVPFEEGGIYSEEEWNRKNQRFLEEFL